jgi:hypothetical protein
MPLIWACSVHAFKIRNSSDTYPPIFAKLEGEAAGSSQRGLHVMTYELALDLIARERHFEKSGYTLPCLHPMV